jgi:hypothetical protein
VRPDVDVVDVQFSAGADLVTVHLARNVAGHLLDPLTEALSGTTTPPRNGNLLTAP